MAMKTLLMVKDYAALDEPPGVRYELRNGELIVTLSASRFHIESGIVLTVVCEPL